MPNSHTHIYIWLVKYIPWLSQQKATFLLIRLISPFNPRFTSILVHSTPMKILLKQQFLLIYGKNPHWISISSHQKHQLYIKSKQKSQHVQFSMEFLYMNKSHEKIPWKIPKNLPTFRPRCCWRPLQRTWKSSWGPRSMRCCPCPLRMGRGWPSSMARVGTFRSY